MSGTAAALLAAALFGASIPLSVPLLAHLTPFQLAGLLYLGAALAMTGPAWCAPRAPAALGGGGRAQLAAAIALGGVLGPVLLLEGLRAARAGSVALLLPLELAATALLGALRFREPLGPRGALAVAGIVAAGVAVAADAGWPGLAAAGWVAAACTCWALDNHLTARLDRLGVETSTFWKGAIAGSMNLGLGLAFAPWRAPALAVAGALALGAASYGASVALSIRAAQQLGATRAQGHFASAPFFGAALAWLGLGEPIGAAQALGALGLAASLALLASSRHAHAHAHAALEHVHAHAHDDGHHAHEHPGLDPRVSHVHWHRHEPMSHHHPHAPDLHHRHPHH